MISHEMRTWHTHLLENTATFPWPAAGHLAGQGLRSGREIDQKVVLPGHRLGNNGRATAAPASKAWAERRRACDARPKQGNTKLRSVA